MPQLRCGPCWASLCTCAVHQRTWRETVSVIGKTVLKGSESARRHCHIGHISVSAHLTARTRVRDVYIRLGTACVTFTSLHTLCVNVRAGEWGASVPSLLPAAKSRQPTYCRWPARLGGPGTWRPSSPCCRCRPAPKRPVPPKASPPPRARGSPSPLSLEGGGRRGAVGGCACVLLNRWGIITDASKNASKICLMKRSYSLSEMPFLCSLALYVPPYWSEVK